MHNNSKLFLEFFGFKRQPFAATSDPAFFYATRAHKECLFRLWSNVDERHGIAVVLGHYGTGKTTLLRKLLTGMRAHTSKYNTAVIGSPIPSWTSFSLLESIVTQFGVERPNRSFSEYMEAFYRYLLDNRRCVNTLIIDDAQNLNKRGQLELLRLVQNLETQQHKLLNMVLFAQLEWIPILRAAPNFAQRINLTYTLKELDTAATRELIDFRLRQAGASERMPYFDETAVRLIQAYANGSPRVTVMLCRNALILSAQLKTRRVGQAIVLHTIQKTTLPDHDGLQRVEAVLANAQSQPQSKHPLETGTLHAGVAPDRIFVTSQSARANALLKRAALAKEHAELAPTDGT